jgi:hypothetical protein
MEVSVESIVSQEVIDPPASRERPSNWDEIHAKVHAYFATWRLSPDFQRELGTETMACLETLLTSDPAIDLPAAAIDEADKALSRRLGESAGLSEFTQNDRLALFLASPEGLDREALQRAAELVNLALRPRRPVETNVSVMETSLPRLPHFRVVAGWFLLIVGLALAFIFTH